jgi:cullin-associated NEDD8-dissociated protein 1
MNILIALRKRMDNEITRVYALRSLIIIANSPSIDVNLTNYFNQIAPDVAQLLKQQNRLLKQTALNMIDSFLKSRKVEITSDVSNILRAEISCLINDNDLQLCLQSINALYNLLQVYPLSREALKPEIYRRILNLSVSPIVQSSTQIALTQFLKYLIETENGLDFFQTFQDLRFNISSSESLQKPSLMTLSKCLSTVVLSTTQELRNQAINELINDIHSTVDSRKVLALLTVGEIGEVLDLFSMNTINNLVLECFNSSSEDVKSSAAYAYGHLAIGSLHNYLPGSEYYMICVEKYIDILHL